MNVPNYTLDEVYNSIPRDSDEPFCALWYGLSHVPAPITAYKESFGFWRCEYVNIFGMSFIIPYDLAEFGPYLDPPKLTSKPKTKCDCDIHLLMREGCKCGALKEERANVATTDSRQLHGNTLFFSNSGDGTE